MKFEFYKIILFIFLSLILITLFIIIKFNVKNKEKEIAYSEIEIKLQQPEFFLSNCPKDHLKDALDYYDILYPDIVFAQAILETGYFRSTVFKKYNNLFGLYNSKTNDYFRFNHWTESIIAYRDYIQKKYHPPGDYYNFLRRIGYAEDPEYTSKVEQIVNKIKENDKRTNTK